jgi:flagellar L-ring protein FlgH
MMKNQRNGLVKLLLIVVIAFSMTGCASINKKLRAIFGKTNNKAQVAEAPASTNPRFSEQDTYKIGVERQYKRMNKEQFEADAQVGDTAGSLWVMEGQGAYLFAQNTKRLVGDMVNITIEGAPQQQLQTKSNVIAKLLKKLERGSEPTPVRNLASVKAPVTQNQQNPQANPQDPNAQNAQAAQPTEAAAQAEAQKPNPSGFDVSQVPARIIETLKDGSYRVKGSQQFMIGKREYKVIVTGIVRPEDFNEEGTSATKILDGQFDIVSSKKGISTL